jgi:exodeoxyribonuclease VII small subunit
MTTGAEDLAARPFDDLIAELQRIVQSLEAGSLPLEEGIALYRRGLELHAACEARLREAELTITELGRGVQGAAAAADPAATDPAVSGTASSEADA